MNLGLVTYNLARDWDLPTLIRNCEETGFHAVELRTTHAHGVELHRRGEPPEGGGEYHDAGGTDDC